MSRRAFEDNVRSIQATLSRRQGRGVGVFAPVLWGARVPSPRWTGSSGSGSPAQRAQGRRRPGAPRPLGGPVPVAIAIVGPPSSGKKVSVKRSTIGPGGTWHGGVARQIEFLYVLSNGASLLASGGNTGG